MTGTPLKEEYEKGNEDGSKHGAKSEEDPGEIVIDDRRWEDVVHWDSNHEREEVKECECWREAESRRPPVERVEVKQLRDPEEADEVVETVVDGKEKPKIKCNQCFSVTRSSVATS